MNASSQNHSRNRLCCSDQQQQQQQQQFCSPHLRKQQEQQSQGETTTDHLKYSSVHSKDALKFSSVHSSNDHLRFSSVHSKDKSLLISVHSSKAADEFLSRNFKGATFPDDSLSSCSLSECDEDEDHTSTTNLETSLIQIVALPRSFYQQCPPEQLQSLQVKQPLSLKERYPVQDIPAYQGPTKRRWIQPPLRFSCAPGDCDDTEAFFSYTIGHRQKALRFSEWDDLMVGECFA